MDNSKVLKSLESVVISSELDEKKKEHLLRVLNNLNNKNNK